MGVWNRLRRVWTRVEIGETRLGGRIQDTDDRRAEASLGGLKLGGESQLEDARRIDARNWSALPRAGTEVLPPAHTGEELKRDVESHADQLERWKREDEKAES